MKVLFITRTYPPQIGGMEKLSYQITTKLSKKTESFIIANKKGKKNLPFFIPYALIKGLFLSRKVDVVHIGDGVLAPIGFIIKKIARKPVLSTVHGLDVTYNNWLHQKINVKALKYLDKIIAISNSTTEECVKRGIDSKKSVVIPIGIEIKSESKNFTKHDLTKFIGFDITNKKTLLSVGRLVKRKGIVWFIENVLPKLGSGVIYLIVGEGSEKKRIQGAIGNQKLSNRVFLLGRISDDDLELVYKTSDVFVMPNIRVKGDMEGFGIVAIEAASRGLPVIASKLEGIRDAIIDQKNGFLIKPADVRGYVNKINEILENDGFRKIFGKKAQEFTKENYNWDKISNSYLEEFKKVSK